MNDPLFIIVDLFCGFGGTTRGFELAEVAGSGIARVFACINHDPKAIASHWANHPEVKHFEEDMRTLDLAELISLTRFERQRFPNAKLILWASLECTNFSKAKGGLPRDADSRTLADHLERYILAIDPDYVKIENVVEFMSWGPLDESGRPVSKKSGSDWLRWREEIDAMGYVNEWQELNSANFGAYTSRNRLFGVFAKPHLPIAWPAPTHAKIPSRMSMYGDLKKWMPVKHVLNFEDQGESIFERKKPLSDKTLERIYAGLVKYIAKGDTAFISKYFSGAPSGMNNSVDNPAGSVTTKDHHSIVQAFLSKTYSGKPEGKNISIDGPAGTITTFGGSHQLVQAAFLSKYYSGDPAGKISSVEDPAGTLRTKDGQALVQPEFMVKYNSMGADGNCNHTTASLEDPCPVIATQSRLALAQAEFIVQRNNGIPTSKLVDIDGPARTLTATGGNQDLVSPEFLQIHNGKSLVRGVDDPAPTIATKDRFALVQPEFLTHYYSGGGQTSSVSDPCPTVTAMDGKALIQPEPFIMPTALVNPSWGGHPGSIENPCCVIIARQDKAPLYFVQVEEGPVSIAIYEDDSPVSVCIKQFMAAYGLVDIKMRMLRVPELLKIQGFPENYKMVGNQSDQKKFIGNSVVPHVVKAWAEAMAAKLTESQKVA